MTAATCHSAAFNRKIPTGSAHIQRLLCCQVYSSLAHVREGHLTQLAAELANKLSQTRPLPNGVPSVSVVDRPVEEATVQKPMKTMLNGIPLTCPKHLYAGLNAAHPHRLPTACLLSKTSRPRTQPRCLHSQLREPKKSVSVTGPLGRRRQGHLL